MRKYKLTDSYQKNGEYYLHRIFDHKMQLMAMMEY